VAMSWSTRYDDRDRDRGGGRDRGRPTMRHVAALGWPS